MTRVKSYRKLKNFVVWIDPSYGLSWTPSYITYDVRAETEREARKKAIQRYVKENPFQEDKDEIQENLDGEEDNLQLAPRVERIK